MPHKKLTFAQYAWKNSFKNLDIRNEGYNALRLCVGSSFLHHCFSWGGGGVVTNRSSYLSINFFHPRCGPFFLLLLLCDFCHLIGYKASIRIHQEFIFKIIYLIAKKSPNLVFCEVDFNSIYSIIIVLYNIN